MLIHWVEPQYTLPSKKLRGFWIVLCHPQARPCNVSTCMPQSLHQCNVDKANHQLKNASTDIFISISAPQVPWIDDLLGQAFLPSLPPPPFSATVANDEGVFSPKKKQERSKDYQEEIANLKKTKHLSKRCSQYIGEPFEGSRRLSPPLTPRQNRESRKV